MKRILSICLALALVLAMIPASSSLAATQYGYVTGGWLRLRSSPSFDASTLSSYNTGTKVTIVNSINNWYQVTTPDGKTGYMYASYVSLTGGGGTTGDAYVTSSNGYGVRMRSGPGTGYKVITTYAVGTAVKVLDSGNTWSKIQVGSRVGYMMNKFLTNNGGGGGNVSGDSATIWSANGYGVRLRSGPGKSYSITGVYSVGTIVTVISHGTTWDYVSVGSRTGYMMNEFLRYFNNKAVTAVTLNNTTPFVGAVLSAASITPSGATVNYAWYAGTDLVGQGSTYPVQPADIDKQIKLTVTGTGDYTGSATSALTSAVAQPQSLVSVAINNMTPVVGDVLRVSEVVPAGAKFTYQWRVGGVNAPNGTGSTYTVRSEDLGQLIQLVITGTGLYTGELTVTTASVTQTGVITGAKITNTTNNTTTGVNAPNVGDKLIVTPEPATASATYAWRYSGTTEVIATTATLDVTEEMETRTLEVVVTGTNNYSNSATVFTGQVVKKTKLTSVALDISTPKFDPSDTTKKLTATAYTEAGIDITSNTEFQWYSDADPVGTNTRDYTLEATDRGKLITVRATAMASSPYSGTASRVTTSTVKVRLYQIGITGGTGSPGKIKVGDQLEPVLNGGAVTANAQNAQYTWTLNGQSSNAIAYTVPAGEVVTKKMKLSISNKGDYYVEGTLEQEWEVEGAEMTVALPAEVPTAGKPYAITVTPTTATATYTWIGGGGGSYTGASITVDAKDIGHKLTLKVTPAKGYVITSDTHQTPNDVVAQTFTVSLEGTFAVGKTIRVVTDPANATFATVTWKLNGQPYQTSASNTLVLPSDSTGKTIEATVTGNGNFAGVIQSTSQQTVTSMMASPLVIPFTAEDGSTSLTLPDDTLVITTPDNNGEAGAVTDPNAANDTDNAGEPVEGLPEGAVADNTLQNVGTGNNEQLVPDVVQPTDVQGEGAVADTDNVESAHIVSLVYKPKGAIVAGTKITPEVDTPELIASVSWYLNKNLLEDVKDNQYIVTQTDIDKKRTLTVVVLFTDGQTATVKVQFAPPKQDTDVATTESVVTETGKDVVVD